jgi:hypothetical protein
MSPPWGTFRPWVSRAARQRVQFGTRHPAPQGRQRKAQNLRRPVIGNTLSTMGQRAAALAALPIVGALVGAATRVALDLAIWGNRVVAQRDLVQAAVIGAVAWLVVGGMALFWRARRASSFRRSSEVVRVLSLPVLTVVPAIWTPAERSARRRRIAWRTIMVALLALPVGYLLWWTRATP